MRNVRSMKHEARSRMIPSLMFLASCLLLPASSANAEIVERVVAIVGNSVITLYDLDRAMAPYVSEINKAPNRDQKYKSVKKEVLDRLVNDLMLKQAVENAKITVTNEDVSRAIRNVLVQNHITSETLQSELAAKGISFESYKEELKSHIQQLKFMNREVGTRIKISDQELQDYYQKHMDEFGIHQSVHIAQIVLPFEDATTSRKVEEMKVKASVIVKQLRGGASFAALAKEHSKGPNADKGGDLGVVDPSNLMPQIVEALDKMKVGQISDPILSPAGVHIIHLIDRAQATGADFEKMKDRIYEKMYDQRLAEELNQYLVDARKKTFVEIRE